MTSAPLSTHQPSKPHGSTPAGLDSANVGGIIYLMDKIPWFGGHTGYEMLPGVVEKSGMPIRKVSPRTGVVPRAIGKLFCWLKGWPARNQASTAAELELMWTWKGERDVVAHVLYVERHLLLAAASKVTSQRLVGTIHLPFSVWKDEQLTQLGHLKSAIVLYQRDQARFESVLGQGRTRFIHHGVDVEFFRPGSNSGQQRHLLFSGVYLRNTAMLERVIRRLSAAHPELIFDMLVPLQGRADTHLQALTALPSVQWHAGLSDEELRSLYQQSSLCLLPMNDSGANTAVVESLACGLPIVTTDVGGIQDYGGDAIYPIVANNDDDAMVEVVERYLAEPELRADIAARCRTFAVETLAWPIVAKAHLQAYQELSFQA